MKYVSHNLFKTQFLSNKGNKTGQRPSIWYSSARNKLLVKSGEGSTEDSGEEGKP